MFRLRRMRSGSLNSHLNAKLGCVQGFNPRLPAPAASIVVIAGLIYKAGEDCQQS